jgi:hypothetical protein
MRDAESLLDQCISAVDGKIDLETVRKVLGLVDSLIVSGLLDAVSRRDREGALAVVDGVVASGMDLEEFFLAFLEGIRNLLVISVSGDRTDWLDLTSGEIEELSAIAGKFQVEDLLFIFRSMSRAHRELKGSSQPRYHIEAAVAEAASWESAVDIGELIGRLDSGTGGTAPASGGSGIKGDSTTVGGPRDVAEGSRSEAGGPRNVAGGPRSVAEGSRSEAGGSTEGGSAGTARTAGSAGTARTAGSVETIPETPVKENPLLESLGGKEEWERFLAQVRESKLTLGIWLMSADVAGIEDGSLILSFTPQNRFAMEMIRQAGNKRLIESHLEKFYGRKFTVETCETVELKEGGRADSQAELEIKVRTKPRTGGSAREPAKSGAVKSGPAESGVAESGAVEEDGMPGNSQAAGAKPGKKPNGTTKGNSNAAKVNNPVLERIMKGLDAELLD